MEFNGLDEEIKEEVKEGTGKENIVEMKPKRKPFVVWTVGGEDYKLKLKSTEICQIESKMNIDLFEALTKGKPPLHIMLIAIQGALQSMNHKMKIADVQNLYDQYVEEGGTQLTLFTDIIMEILKVSGFFTKNQVEIMEESLENVKELL